MVYTRGFKRTVPIPLLTVFLGLSCIGQALPVAHATTIAGIRTPEQVVIAADSLGTARGYRIESTRPVCKIFRVTTWAWVAIGLTFLFRFTLPITIGSFFGAMNVWGWHWAAAAVFSAPGLALIIPGALTCMFSSFKVHRK